MMWSLGTSGGMSTMVSRNTTGFSDCPEGTLCHFFSATASAGWLLETIAVSSAARRCENIKHHVCINPPECVPVVQRTVWELVVQQTHIPLRLGASGCVQGKLSWTRTTWFIKLLTSTQTHLNRFQIKPVNMYRGLTFKQSWLLFLKLESQDHTLSLLFQFQF